MHAMRCVALLALLTAFGCSSSNFDVAAEATDTGTTPADTSAARDSRVTSDAVGTETDTEPEPFDASGPPCTTIDDCEPGSFCRRAACDLKEGVCAPFVTTTSYEPVCGCDGVTYWNKSHAWIGDATIRHAGRCTNVEGAACLGTTCELPDSICVHELDNAAACTLMLGKGICWRLPLDHNCGAAPGGTVSTCDGKCTTYCSGVRNKQPFYAKTCTPG